LPPTAPKPANLLRDSPCLLRDSSMAATHRVSAVIFDLDGTLLDTERATRDVLKEFLGTYGKVPDAAKEEKRLGQMHRESTTGIIADYGLPITVEEYSEAIYPLYIKRFGSFYSADHVSVTINGSTELGLTCSPGGKGQGHFQGLTGFSSTSTRTEYRWRSLQIPSGEILITKF
uniref:Uncharacterized protein n=1 Tax=Aegilops tauschii subsp. strangulata TaxID=200361 RepID=A0A453FJF5_AEGTS